MFFRRKKKWHDPTHGRIDRDIQEFVDIMKPNSLGQRNAIEITLQDKRNRGEAFDE